MTRKSYQHAVALFGVLFRGAVAALLCAGCLSAGASVNVAACPAIHQHLVALLKAQQNSMGCPVKPNKPLQQMSDGSTGNPNNKGCQANTQSAQQWTTAHAADLAKTKNDDQACYASACPAVFVSICPRLGPGLPCNPALIDSDGDGIPDQQEAALIARFSPLLRFTKDEDNRPLDPLQFVRQSDLVLYGHDDDSQDTVLIPNSQLSTTPGLVTSYAWTTGTSVIDSYAPSADYKSCVASISANGKYNGYAIRPRSSAWPGADWSQISGTTPVGMFAHVSPFVPNSASDLPGEHYAKNAKGTLVATAANCALRQDGCNNAANPVACAVIPPSTYVSTCKDCVKIEYYQFFGYDNAHEAGVTNHEGDLSIVTLIYDRDKDAAASISHWVHGIELRYDLLDPASNCSTETGPSIPGEAFTNAQKTCRGSNSGFHNLELMTAHTKHTVNIGRAQNNTVSFVADAGHPAAFEHPVVFVERGSHEFWPTVEGSVWAAPNHNGDDLAHSYLAQNIPNLGEIEHPLGDVGKVMVNYLGYWGATNGLNQSSPGPSLHTTWNWYVPNRTPIACTSAEN